MNPRVHRRGLYPERPKPSNSSIVRGQSFLSSRESARSAGSFPPAVILEADHDALADAPQLRNALAVYGLDRRLGRAQEKRTRDTHTFKPLIDDSLL